MVGVPALHTLVADWAKGQWWLGSYVQVCSLGFLLQGEGIPARPKRAPTLKGSSFSMVFSPQV